MGAPRTTTEFSELVYEILCDTVVCWTADVVRRRVQSVLGVGGDGYVRVDN